MPVKVEGPEPEQHELLFHEQAQVDPTDHALMSIKKEPPSCNIYSQKENTFCNGR